MLFLGIEAVVEKGKRRATQHRCPFCKFEGNLAGNWRDGLNVHITKKHKNKLLDGTQLSQQQRKRLEKCTQTADLIKVLSTLKGNFLKSKAKHHRRILLLMRQVFVACTIVTHYMLVSEVLFCF